MVKKSIGYLRNFVIKHKKLYPIIKELIVSDESVIILKKDNNFKVAGNVQSDAMAVYMLGVALATSYESAKANEPALKISDYLTQPVNVAMAQLERKGLIE